MLSERIAILDQRLELMEGRIDYSQKKSWTNYITLDPIQLLQNLFGGGEVQRDRIAIADLEIKTADLFAAKAELERQEEEEKVLLGDKVLKLVLNYEEAESKYNSIQSQLVTHNQQREVFRISYRLGYGNTSQILDLEEKGDRLEEQLLAADFQKDEIVRDLVQLTSIDR